MECILNPYTNPYFNLACEEYLLHSLPQGFIMLWQNHQTVVLGKHQNALAEINFEYVKQHQIKVARRISGGGTVFHDSGNLNFTIALPNQGQSNTIDFRRFIDPIITYLQSLGANAYASGRNDILIDDFKVSGNAEHFYRKKNIVLHHGTLLFNSDLESLGKAIKAPIQKYTDRAVASKRSPVQNIQDSIHHNIDFSTFREGLQQKLMSHFGISVCRQLSCEETDHIEALAVTKFEKENWIYGYSPAYQIETNLRYGEENSKILMQVAREGVIQSVEIMETVSTDTEQWIHSLTGKTHWPVAIQGYINSSTPTLSSSQKEALHLSLF